ncbi:MAG TPA: ABC transporter ATP-binding protein [Methylomirabilota bacterium]|nr:ABC transporter ATP-binding protein [Methylomirabilota bacterium]
MTAPQDEAAIVCRALTKRYDSVVALDALDLEVPAGSVFGFLGPNGAGKTTTLRLLTSLAQATSGTAALAGVPVGEGEPNRRGLFGYLDQDPRFHGWMTPRELLDLVGRLYRMPAAERRSRIDESLETVGLTDASRRPIGTLSGGMRQRLGVAQAILNRPPIVLLDEPVSSLDPEGRVDMLEVIRRLGGGSTVLFSTHILTDVERVCDRVAILDHGRLVTTGLMTELLDRYARPIYRVEPEDGQADAVARLTESLLMTSFVTHVAESSAGLRVAVSEAPNAGRDLLEMVAAHSVALLVFERQRPTLEDVFLQLVGRKAHETGAAA